ncbi:MAG: aminopeptidase [Bdellovibrionota bacterium]|nr:MAG: aminopeptidase [Bdellovibrionota bacterium]
MQRSHFLLQHQWRSFPRLALLLFLLLGVCLLCASGCAPSFVMRAAWEEFKILQSREPLVDSIGDESISAERRQKLALIQEVHRFIPRLGLEVGGLYTSYAELDRDTLLWVLMASRRDAFELYQWWFPFVGSVPYKGFFDKEDGKLAAKELEDRGFETSLRTTDAFSTLGWFDDPVLSTMLQRDQVELADLIIHETFHANIWIPGNVAFNESAAHYVGMQGSVEYFTFASQVELAKTAQQRQRWHIQFAGKLAALIEELSALYASNASSQEKISRRQSIYSEAVSEIMRTHPSATLPKEINNASLMQWRVYMTHLERFEALFERCKGNWDEFMEELRLIALLAGRSRSLDPFALLAERAQSCEGQTRNALKSRYVYIPPE